MNDLIRWLTAWIQEEFDVLRTALSDRTGRDVHAAMTALARHYTHASLIEIDRPATPDEAWFARSTELMRFVAPRRLFKAVEYVGDSGDAIWRAYLGGHNVVDDDAAYYARCYFVRRAANAFQIFSSYAPDSEARELGNNLEGWYWVRGARIGDPGEPTEVRRLHAPGKPRDRREFDRGLSPMAARS
jgi:hypothetical protein